MTPQAMDASTQVPGVNGGTRSSTRSPQRSEISSFAELIGRAEDEHAADRVALGGAMMPQAVQVDPTNVLGPRIRPWCIDATILVVIGIWLLVLFGGADADGTLDGLASGGS